MSIICRFMKKYTVLFVVLLVGFIVFAGDALLATGGIDHAIWYDSFDKARIFSATDLTGVVKQLRCQDNYQHDGYSCGYRAKSYALALDSFVAGWQKSGVEALAADNKDGICIDRKARDFFNRINPGSAYYRSLRGAFTPSDDILPLADEQVYSHFYMVRKGEKVGKGNLFADELIFLNYKSADHLAESVAAVHKKGKGCVHCICLSNNNHWVLYSYVLPSPQSTPYTIYIDSKNNLLTKNSFIYPCIQEVNQLFYGKKLVKRRKKMSTRQKIYCIVGLAAILGGSYGLYRYLTNRTVR